MHELNQRRGGGGAQVSSPLQNIPCRKDTSLGVVPAADADIAELCLLGLPSAPTATPCTQEWPVAPKQWEKQGQGRRFLYCCTQFPREPATVTLPALLGQGHRLTM